MNQQPDNKDSDAIRSDIDSTRQRMDNTIDALEERFKGRHLLDEVLGFLRPDSTPSEAGDVAGKIKDSAGTAARAVVDTVRANPVPTLLIGAGVAWMLYQRRRSAHVSAPERGVGNDDEYDNATTSDLGYDIPETAYLSQQEYYKKDLNSKSSGAMSSKSKDVKEVIGEKIAELKARLNEASAKVGGRARHTARAVRNRAGEMYINRRDQVAGTVAKYPLEVAAGCLVAGLVVGLCLPTSQKVDEVVGPTTDRLKRKAREAGQDLAQRGRRVVQAATTAIREEAEAQGLTPEALRKKAGSVADRAGEAASDTAEKEGILPPSSRSADGGSEKNEPPLPSV